MQEYKGFHAAYFNFGGQAQTNFVHNVEIWKDGSPEVLFSTDPMPTVSVGEQDTTMLEATVWPCYKGEYEFVHFPSTDELDDIPSNDTLYHHLKVGDSLVRVVDFTKVNSSISPDNWESFDEDGDGLGFMINLPHPSLHDLDGNADYYILEGVSLYVASNTRDEEIALFENGEAKVIAGMYKYDTITDTYTEQISSSEYTLTIYDTNSIVYIPFAQDGTSEYVFEGGTYVLAINMYGIWTDAFGRLQSWNVMNADNSIHKGFRESCVTVNATIADASDVGWTGEGPAIGLNIGYSEEYTHGDDFWTPYCISFNVENTLGDPIQDAFINAGEYGSQYTDSLGKAYYCFIESISDYNYYIVNEGMDTVFGTLNYVEWDVTLNITMNGVSLLHQELIGVLIYPNPSNGIFTIELDGTYDVQIIDVSGKVVHETRVNEQAQIEIPNATKGIYFIKCRKDNYTITKTIIVE